MGTALGRGIPVILLTAESFDVPIDLATLRHLKTDLNDPKLLDFQVQLLLSSLDVPKGKRKSAQSTPFRQPKTPKMSPQGYASALEEAIATAVVTAGGRVTLPERGSKEQASADFLMWFPEIDKVFFNPAAIEVKSRIELPRIANIHARLGQFVTSSGFGCGLIEKMIRAYVRRLWSTALSFLLVTVTLPFQAAAQSPATNSGGYSGQGAPLSTDELQQPVAPIALYPDAR